MTEKLFYENQYINEFTAQVVSCSLNGKNYETVLNRTAFFPEGGGQPGDTGFIGDSPVIDTIEKNGEIIHICEKEIPCGTEVKCALDFDRRFTHMQLHSGEHVFSGFVHSLLGLDNVGFHMGEHSVTVDFNGAVSREKLDEIETLSNEAVYKNIPVEILYPTDDELKNYDYRSKKELTGQVRLTKIEGVDLCACCGTHVALTGEIGLIKAVSMMNYKSGVRITLQIGRKALEDYREKNNSVAEISNLLCAKPEEVAHAVSKLLDRMNENKAVIAGLKKELFALRCESMSGRTGILFDDEGSADSARVLCDMLAEKTEIAAAFSGDDENGYKYALASRSEDVRALGKELNAACSGRGGGKPEMVQGSVSASRSEIEKFWNGV